MAATFQPTGHAASVFAYLQEHPDEWHDSVVLAHAIGVSPGTASPAIRTLERNHYLIIESRPDAGTRTRLWVRSVKCPGKPCCGSCGVKLTDGREVECTSCLPYDPAKSHPELLQCDPMKAKLLAERRAQGLPLFLESGERNYRRGL